MNKYPLTFATWIKLILFVGFLGTINTVEASSQSSLPEDHESHATKKQRTDTHFDVEQREDSNLKTQINRASAFKQLHKKGVPLVLVNIWDAGSAKAVASSGAKAIATSSWSIADSQGYEDGEKLPFELALKTLKQIVASVDLPVTFDFEGGYAQTLSALRENTKQVISAGAVGINFEDQVVSGEGLYSIKDQCERISVIREVANQASVPVFINARTDIFFKGSTDAHNENHLKEALERASAYAHAGADGFFVPGLSNLQYIEQLCAKSPLPVNIMVLGETPSFNELTQQGVSRISSGPGPYLQAMGFLKKTASNVHPSESTQK